MECIKKKLKNTWGYYAALPGCKLGAKEVYCLKEDCSLAESVGSSIREILFNKQCHWISMVNRVWNLLGKQRMDIRIINKRAWLDNPAPMVIFAYCRLDSTKRLIASLEKNQYINQMDCYIFTDIPIKEELKEPAYALQEYLKWYKEHSRFKRVQLKIASKHKGLRSSVIEGVTDVIEKYGKVIVCEDDLVVSNDFVEYMQKALLCYEKDKKIFSITGSSFGNVKSIKNYPYDVYMLDRMCSWGWASWKDRWEMVDWELKDYQRVKHNPFVRWKINKGGCDLAQMLDMQLQKQIDSWAVCCEYCRYKQNMLVVYSCISKVQMCGDAGFATHGSGKDKDSAKVVYQKKGDIKYKFVHTNRSERIFMSAFKKERGVSYGQVWFRHFRRGLVSACSWGGKLFYWVSSFKDKIE